MCPARSPPPTARTRPACGFDAPLAVVQVTTATEQKTLTYASGTDGDYLMVEGDDSIYAVDGSIVQAVTQTADALTAPERRKNPILRPAKNRWGAGFFYGLCKVSANLDRVIDICPRIVYDKP